MPKYLSCVPANQVLPFPSKCQPKNRKMTVNGGQEWHQIDCHMLNFAWNIASGMHLAWNGSLASFVFGTRLGGALSL
jgi:hypothetical protein